MNRQNAETPYPSSITPRERKFSSRARRTSRSPLMAALYLLDDVRYQARFFRIDFRYGSFEFDARFGCRTGSDLLAQEDTQDCGLIIQQKRQGGTRGRGRDLGYFNPRFVLRPSWIRWPARELAPAGPNEHSHTDERRRRTPHDRHDWSNLLALGSLIRSVLEIKRQIDLVLWSLAG